MPRITPLPYQRLCRVFELVGFRLVRQEGDHCVYTKPGVSRPIIIPCYRAVPVFIIMNNLRTAGVSRNDYFSLLEKT